MKLDAIGRSALVIVTLAAASCETTAPTKGAWIDLDGSRQSPLDTSGARANVVVFITVDCPIANGYAPTIQKLAKEFGSRGVRFFLVHVDPDVTDAEARQHADDYGYESPILMDRSHALVSLLEAEHTPEAFLLTGASQVVYRGRIDDLYGDLGKKRPAPRTHDLRDALEAVLAGRSPRPDRTKAIGCFIPEL